ncbi:MAG TPA: GtrA family protein [Hyphomicrobiaceae bacterium]|jgi:putative flippase GtrA|nr:GtrA family protein [Hyphomicrobiaceae bacterium]
MQRFASPTTGARRSRLRHGLAFLLSGGLAFMADAVTLKALTVLVGLNPMLARLFAISLAMLVGWLAHRTFTFALQVPPSLAEFLRYAVVGWSVAAVNYGLFVLILLLWPAAEPLLALIVSSLFATLFAYLGMRYGAFRVERGG